MRQTLTGLISAGLLLSAGAAIAGSKDSTTQYYRWVDENGTVHFGDSVPAEYADRQRQVLNEQGVTIGTMAGQPSEQERLQQEAARADELAREQATKDQARRDQVLLKSYTSADEIVALRDRRVDMMNAQIRVTEIYLGNLREKLSRLEEEASKFSPYNDNPNAKPLDEKLALEISTILESIMAYEDNLQEATVEQGQLMARFDEEISRYRELMDE